MAQKQYSFDFILNAVLNGGFSGTFNKAQQEFIRLGAEIRNFQSIQRDVRAYEKQQQAVQNTSQKLENLERQQELVKKQIAETTGSTTALEREKLKLEQRISSTEGALDKQQQKLGETKERLEEAGISTDNLAGKDEELTKKIEELTEEQKKAAEGAGEFGNAGVQAIEAVGGAIAAAGIAGAMKNIADAYRECVEVAADFEQAMSAVEAIADSDASEMAALTAEAKELGATTVFTAQQSAGAMEYMAMAGWDAQEMLAGMRGITTLAAAAGEDLAQVSDIVTDNLSAFGLQASDTAHFADVLAAAAANSNTNISIMGETFKSASSVAGALGYRIEDVAVMVGLMANNAVKGSRAGTALRNIFNGLLGGATLTAKAFGELDYTAVNSDGSMKGLMETVEELRGYFDQMTEAERVNNAMTIAGMRGYNGLLAILGATDEDFQSLYTSINNCSGAAERMAAVKLDNLNGDITLMNSAMEALKSTIGEQFNPELRSMTQWLTGVLNGFDALIQEEPSLSKGIMAATAAAGGLTGAILGINAAIKAFKALKALGVFSGLTGGMFLAVGAAAALVGTIVAVVDAVRDGGPAVRELTEAARGMDEAIEEAGATLEDTAEEILAAANTADFYVGKLDEIKAAEGDNAAQSREYQNTLALLLQVMPSLSDCISTTTDEYGRANYALETNTAALYKNIEAQKESAKARAYQAYLNTLMEEYNGVMLEAAKNEIELTKAQSDREKAEKKHSDAVRRMNELWQEASEEAERQSRETGTIVETIECVTQEYRDLENALPGLADAIWAAEQSEDAHKKAVERDGEAIAEAEEKINWAKQAWEELTKALGFYTGGQEEMTEQEAAVREALGETMASLQALAEEYTETYNAALESFQGQFGLFDEARADAGSTVEAAQRALETQRSYWQEYAANIAILKEISAEDLDVTQENYDALMEFVRSGTPEAAGLAADMVRAIKKGDTLALANLANTLGEISKSQNEAAAYTAEWTTGLNKQMERLIQDMEKQIGEMDMSAEAAESGRATIQAYIDAAADMLPQVKTAYESVAREAKRALANAVVASSDWDGHYFSVPGHNAGGTGNAPPGWSWVGEEGPELMRLHGGEQILPSHVSQEVARVYQIYNEYSGEYAAAKAIERDLNPAQAETASGWDGHDFSVPGYAGGTGNAPPGWSWVGEEGPELMRLHGGEQILPSHVSQEVARVYQIYNEYSGEYAAAKAIHGFQGGTRPALEVATGGHVSDGQKTEIHFHIEAGALPETVDAWRDYANSGELRETILKVMEEAQADTKRRMML